MESCFVEMIPVSVALGIHVQAQAKGTMIKWVGLENFDVESIPFKEYENTQVSSRKAPSDDITSLAYGVQEVQL